MSKQEGLFREDRHLSHQGVALYVDALKLERIADLPQELVQHVELCYECKAEITGLFSLVKEETYFHEEPHPTFINARATWFKSVPVWSRAAAAVILVVGAGALLYRLVPSTPPVPQTAAANRVAADSAPSRTTEPSGPRDPLAFAESPALETLVDGTLRSSAAEGVFPPNGATVRTGTVFSYREAEGRRSTELVFLSNKEIVVRTAKMQGGRYVLREPLPPGLYYWKLIGAGELLHVGKFIVR